MLYAYGAVRQGQKAPPGARLVEVGGVAVAVSEVSARVEPTPERIAQHHRICMELLQGGGVAPFRFGNVFESEEQLRQAVQAREAELERTLARLAGCVELNIRVTLDRSPRPASGTEYLRRRKRELELADRLKAELGALLEDWRQEIKPGEIRAACLVPADRVPEVKARVAAFEPKARLTGPWPPSSFV